jgi:hypothetical protein
MRAISPGRPMRLAPAGLDGRLMRRLTETAVLRLPTWSATGARACGGFAPARPRSLAPALVKRGTDPPHRAAKLTAHVTLAQNGDQRGDNLVVEASHREPPHLSHAERDAGRVLISFPPRELQRQRRPTSLKDARAARGLLVDNLIGDIARALVRRSGGPVRGQRGQANPLHAPEA